MSRTKRTTILTIAAVATLLAALATPVSAKKPDKPAPPAEFVNVTMEILDGEGVAIRRRSLISEPRTELR